MAGSGIFDDLVPGQPAARQPGAPMAFSNGRGITVVVGEDGQGGAENPPVQPPQAAPVVQAAPLAAQPAPAQRPADSGIFADLTAGQGVPAPAATPNTPTSQVTGFLANLNRGLGLGDEVAAGLGTVRDLASGAARFGADQPGNVLANNLKMLGDTYNMELAKQRQEEGGFNVGNPHLAALARGTGMALPIMFTGGAAAPELATGRIAALAKGAAAGGGAAYGYGLTDAGSPMERIEAANKNILPGMALGALSGAFSPVTQSAPSVASAADHAITGVDPIPAVVGTPSMQRIGQMLKGIPMVGQPLAAAADRTAHQLDVGVQGLAGRLGPSTDPLGAGSALQRGATGAVDRYADTASKLYEPVNALEANAAPIPVSHTQGAIADLFAKYPTIPDWLAKNAPQLMSVKNTLEGANGQLTFGELKAMRSDIGELIDQHLTVGNIDQARLKTIYGAMSDDMMEGAGHLGGPDAQAALSRADTYHAAKSARIKDVLDGVVQANSPEQAYGRVLAMAGSNARADLTKLGQIKRSLDPDAWGDFAGGVLAKMGRDGDGHFSPDRFVTAYNKMTPSGRQALFGVSTADLDALSRVAQQQKSVGKFYNHSNSGNHAIGAMLLFEPIEGAIGHLVGGNVGGAISSVAAPVASGIAGNAFARLLANPGFGRTLLTAHANPAIADRLIESYAQQNPSVAAIARQYAARLQHNLGQGLAGVGASVPNQQPR